MEGFRRVPSSITLFSSRYLYTVDMKRFWCTAVVAWSWSPSIRTSGSTIGTRPVSWQIRAYLANPHAASVMARSVGNPFDSSILIAELQGRYGIGGRQTMMLEVCYYSHYYYRRSCYVIGSVLFQAMQSTGVWSSPPVS